MRKISRRKLLSWSSTSVLGITIGVWLGTDRPETQDLYFASPPVDPATVILTESLFDFEPKYIESTDGLQRVSERDGETESVSLKFYCPRESREWGEMVLKWTWDAGLEPRTAVLEPNMLVVPAFDPATTAEIYISSAATRDKWIRLLRLEKGLESIELNRAIDVSAWVRQGDYLRVKYRLKASKLMTHPTPDDPIGFAGAQCLRQLRNKPSATRLLLWK